MNDSMKYEGQETAVATCANGQGNLPACAPLMQNLSRSPVISDLSGGASSPFSVSVRAPYLPWSRTFESCFTIDVQSEPPA